MTVSVTWHGHGTFSMDVNGTKVVVDPFFAGNNPIAKTSADQVEADFILQTHGHGDHIADTIPLAKRTGAMVVSNFEICNWINAQGHDNCHALNIGGGYHFDFGYVKMTSALHSCGLPDGSYGGDPGGFLISTDNKKIYFSGDTALYTDMTLIGRAQDLDLAVIPIGDNFTMGPDDALFALYYLRPRRVIPCHYNTWPLIEQDVEAWAQRVRAETDCEPIVLDIDETYSF